MAKCPAHEDRTASLSINTGDDGRVLIRCHAGCELDAILHAVHLERRDLFPQNGNGSGERHILKTYDYQTTNGELLFQVVRYAPKDFRQRQPDHKGGWIYNAKGVDRVVYHLPEIQGQQAVFIAEREKDADRVASIGLPATTCSGGAEKWRDTYTEQLKAAGVTRVAILPDNDAPGRKHAEHVATSCEAAGLAAKIVTLPDVPPKGDVSDYLDAGHTKADLTRLAKAAPRYTPPTAETAVDLPVVQSLSTVKREEVSWIWGRRIASKKLIIVGGEPGEGKSTFTLDVAARITQGAAWPDGGVAPQGSVLLLSAEDGLGDTIAPRLDAAGADSTYVHALTAIRSTDGTTRHADLSRDLPQLEAAIRQVQPVLVIIDPLSAYLGKTDTWKDSEVRSLLSPLVALADRYACAIVGVMHLSKSSGRKALHRLLGSIGFSAAARVVLAVATDPEDDSRRFLLPVKNNLTPPADVLAFTLGAGRIEWDTTPVEGVTADSVLNELPSEPSERQDADSFLTGMLAGGEPVPSRTIVQGARDQGIAERTLRRAKERLGVRAKLVGFGASGKWHWWIPLSESTEAATRSTGHQAPRGGQFPRDCHIQGGRLWQPL